MTTSINRAEKIVDKVCPGLSREDRAAHIAVATAELGKQLTDRQVEQTLARYAENSKKVEDPGLHHRGIGIEF